MKRDITPYHVGASLYIPATHRNLQAVLAGKYETLRSVIIDFEDAIDQNDFHQAHEHLNTILASYEQTRLLVFIRPRTCEHLERLLQIPDVDKIDGFVLAKFDTTNMQSCFSLIPSDFWVMPVLESSEIFEQDKRLILRTFLEHQTNVLMLRLGGEDLSSRLLLRRNSKQTWYDLIALRHLFAQIVLEFKPKGFILSAPVMTYYKDEAMLKKELAHDRDLGLFGKTIIHPAQIDVCHDHYRLTQEEAHLLDHLKSTKEALSSLDGAMIEKAPHQRMQVSLELRKELYGVI